MDVCCPLPAGPLCLPEGLGPECPGQAPPTQWPLAWPSKQVKGLGSPRKDPDL